MYKPPLALQFFYLFRRKTQYCLFNKSRNKLIREVRNKKRSAKKNENRIKFIKKVEWD